MNFGQAIEALKEGKRVCRRGWNGKGMWLELQRPDPWSKMERPYIFIKPPDGADGFENGGLVPWLASQTDMLGEDWMILTE